MIETWPRQNTDMSTCLVSLNPAYEDPFIKSKSIKKNVCETPFSSLQIQNTLSVMCFFDDTIIISLQGISVIPQKQFELGLHPDQFLYVTKMLQEKVRINFKNNIAHKI